MRITKKYRVESAHIVRSCTSERCSHSIHGHSAKIEVSLKSSSLDNAMMVYDFGLMGSAIKGFIDSMDHCYLLCSKDKPEFKQFIKENCERWIELPFNPSAEMLSMFVWKGCDHILNHTGFSNGESGDLKVDTVKYHETKTGSAECDAFDVYSLWKDEFWNNITYSEGVKRDWSKTLQAIMEGESVQNPEPRDRQIDFNL